jgi:hypothetical protein
VFLLRPKTARALPRPKLSPDHRTHFLPELPHHRPAVFPSATTTFTAMASLENGTAANGHYANGHSNGHANGHSVSTEKLARSQASLLHPDAGIR